MMTTPGGGGNQPFVSLPLEMLPGWLFGIDAGRVKPELKEKIQRYRRECFRVLWQAFKGEAGLDRTGTGTGPAPSAGLLQIREMGLAIVKMAEEQIELERNITRAHTRLDQAALAFKALDQRMTGLEKKLSPSTLITDDHAAEISAAVKALAEYLSSQDKSKNHYQGVFTEIYRRFGVSSYKNIRADQFSTVLKFLEDWRNTGQQKDK